MSEEAVRFVAQAIWEANRADPDGTVLSFMVSGPGDLMFIASAAIAAYQASIASGSPEQGPEISKAGIREMFERGIY